MVYSIFFVVSFLFLWSGLLLVKKTNTEENIIVWIPMLFMGILCYHAFMAGILNLIKIPIVLPIMAIVDTLFAVFLWWKIVKDGQRQRLKFDCYSVITLFLIGIVALIGCKNQFGFHLDINYLTTDLGTHYRQALTVMQNKEIINMYFAPLNNGLFLEVFQPFLHPTKLYKAFILADVIMYFMSGALFFGLIREKVKNNYGKVVAAIAAITYMLGYPRNNMVFGFVYLGMGVSIVIFIMFLVKRFVDSKEKNILMGFLLLCGLLSIGICYSLFAPIIFCAVAVVISWDLWRRKQYNIKKSWKNILVVNFSLFLLPCILILAYSVFKLSALGTEISAGIAQEGFVYRELFSNFLFILPLALVGLYILLKEKHIEVVVPLFFFLFGFMVVLAYFGTKGEVSSYYFYKNHYLMIMILFYLAFCGTLYMGKMCKPFVVIYAGIIMVLAVTWFGGLESKFQGAAKLYVPEIKSNYFFHIYNFNKEVLNGMAPYSVNKIQLYETYYERFKDEEYVIFNGFMEDFQWFRGITQRVDFDKNIQWTIFKEAEIAELTRPGITTALDKKDRKILDATIKKEDLLQVYVETSKPKAKAGMMIIVMNKIEGTADWKELGYADRLKVVYENPAGCIAILENVEE